MGIEFAKLGMQDQADALYRKAIADAYAEADAERLEIG
jgi:hypothetical protein